MNKKDQATLKEISNLVRKIRRLLPAQSHLIVKWGNAVKDEPEPREATVSDACPICHGKIFIA